MNPIDKKNCSNDYKNVNRVTLSGVDFLLRLNEDGTYYVSLENPDLNDLPDELKTIDLSCLKIEDLERIGFCPIVETIRFDENSSPKTDDYYLKSTKHSVHRLGIHFGENTEDEKLLANERICLNKLYRLYMGRNFLKTSCIYRHGMFGGEYVSEFFLVVKIENDNVFTLESCYRPGHIEEITLTQLLDSLDLYSPVELNNEIIIENGQVTSRRIFKKSRPCRLEHLQDGKVFCTQELDGSVNKKRPPPDRLN
ncbi:hypothetical protein JW911_02675 [Candidatus Peregrinibacteria bacterium]|nr:hypothetical protein [Candidatus Peregrinibacteria bacterium]